jgi:hypothetical protein
MGKNSGDNPDFSDYCQEDMFGAHICSIYRDTDEQLTAIIPYIVFGLKRNEKCLYIIDQNDPEYLYHRLKVAGIRPVHHIQSGQLSFLNKEQTYLKEGFFSPIAMFDMLQQYHYETLKSNYMGVRGTGEMSWASDNPPNIMNLLLDYESRLNSFLPSKRMVAVCQYNEKKFQEEVLLNVLYTHPKVIIYGNLYANSFYKPPERFEREKNLEYLPGTYQQVRDKIIYSAS